MTELRSEGSSDECVERVGLHLKQFYDTLCKRVDNERTKLDAGDGMSPENALFMLDIIRSAYRDNFRRYWERKK